MRALVTGAAGFVGSWLVRDLAGSGYTTFAGGLGEAPADPLAGAEGWVPMDVTSAASVREALAAVRPQVVFHLAGQASVGDSFADPEGTWEVNATGTLRIACSLPRGARMLVVSSAEVYGAVPESEQPIREDRPLSPGNPYAASKAAAEMAALQAGAAGSVAIVVARAFNHTGPGQDDRFALPSFARQLAVLTSDGGDPVLRVGNLSARRDLLDVRDVVRAYRILMERGTPGMVYNVASGIARSMTDVVAELVRISGRDARVEVDEERVRPVDVPLLVGDASRLNALGWRPEIPFATTLRDLFNWQMGHRS
jgi:GDP-4-dehydro-6-deoxy-D-mannose reductase